MLFLLVYTNTKEKRKVAHVEAKSPEEAMREVMNYPDCLEICGIKIDS